LRREWQFERKLKAEESNMLFQGKRSHALVCVGVCAVALLSADAWAQGPVVSNVTFSQSPNGTAGTKMDIFYDLASPNGNCTVSAKASKDNGATFPFNVRTATGDIGPNVAPGTGKHIVWDIAADYPGETVPQGKIRIIADDGTGPTPGEEATFAGMRFVWIPAGTFMMGRYAGEQDSDSDEDPQHQVTLTQGFWMGKYEVTQAQWQAVMGSNPSGITGDTSRPVEQVSWNDITQANGFLDKLNQANPGLTFRLPTEAEWEYACRAGTTTRFYWGDDPPIPG